MSKREVPASIGQRLLWFLEHYRADSASLNCPIVVRLHGDLDIDALKTSINRVSARHDALRTTLKRRGRNLVQEVHDSGEIPFEFTALDSAATGSGAVESAFQSALAAELTKPVDISSWPTRSALWRLGPEEHALCLNMHHLVADAWSCGIVMQDVIKFLDAGPDREPDLAPITWQYPDYAAWQHEQLSSGALRRHQDYWVRQLDGMQLVDLPPVDATTGPRDMAVVTAGIDAQTFARLRAVARGERTTVFAVMLSIYYLMLHRMTGQRDLSIASLFANRSRREVQSTVGFFANMLVLRSQLESADTFLDVVRKVRGTVVEAFLHEGIPYQMLPIQRRSGAGRVDDVVFQMLLTPPPGTNVRARGVEFELYTPDTLGSRFGVELGLIPQTDGGCKAMLFYTRQQFSPAHARTYLDQFLELARDAARGPEIRPVVAGTAR